MPESVQHYCYEDQWRRKAVQEWRSCIEPLTTCLSEYDSLRLKLETEGGNSTDIAAVASRLDTAITLQSRYGSDAIALAEPEKLQRFLDEVSWYSAHLQVRRDPATGLPLYYLARLGSDYWMYRLIVEDLYLSPGFAMDDERFVQLMGYSGHEQQYLRLSALRAAAMKLVTETEPAADAGDVDRFLVRMGRNIFSAAWHSDQRVSSAVARHLAVPEVLHAVELLYLVLSGDLSEIRDDVAGDPRAHLFFTHVFPQPAIQSLLGILPHLDGGQLAELPRRALHLYGRLTTEFNRFLRTPVRWSTPSRQIPVFKIILSNWRRLDHISHYLLQDRALRQATGQLAGASRRAIEELLSVSFAEPNIVAGEALVRP